MATEQGYDSALWTRICTGMCWQAIHIPAEFGGMGLGYVELVATMEQMGRFLLCSPYFSTVCLAANALLATFDITADDVPPGQAGSVRVRLFTGDAQGYRYSEFPAEPQLLGGEVAGAVVSQSLTSVYQVPPQAEGGVGLAFDLINFNLNAPANYAAGLDAATISEAAPPV